MTKMLQNERKYDRESFKKFLVDRLDMASDSANCYISYVNSISKLLDKPICQLVIDDTVYENEFREVRLYGKRNWTAGLKALFRFFHDGREPKSETNEKQLLSDSELLSIIVVDGEHIKGVDTPIFRYMPAERYYELIEEQTITLSHISNWQDPYEGFVYRGGINMAHEPSDAARIYELFRFVYGQSWTLESKESDVLWRAMSNGNRKETVRVQTTVGALALAILRNMDTAGRQLIRIGCVEYIENSEFKEKLKLANLSDNSNGHRRDHLDFLFFKRKEFSLEKEVRVAMLADGSHIDNSKCKRGDLLKFEIDPRQLINGVLTDPCMERRIYEQLVCRTMCAAPEIKLNTIQRSTLFDWPKLI